MIAFIFFLCGIFFMLLIHPFLINVSELFNNLCELQSYKIAKKIYDIQLQMNQTPEEQEEEKFQMGFHTDCIGYEYQAEDREDYDEEQ